MELEEKIDKQIAAGYSTSDIYENLFSSGHSKEEIDTALLQKSKEMDSKKTSPLYILLGVLMSIVVIFRISRYANSSGTTSTIAFISILTGTALAIYFFTKKK